MEIGTKVRYKHDNPGLPRGTTGRVTDIDFFTGEIRVRFDNGAILVFPGNQDDLDIIREEKGVKCPNSLLNWYKAVEPYLKGEI